MSVLFLIRSEEELRIGTPWVAAFAESMDAAVVPVVVGEDRTVLEKHVASVAGEQFDGLLSDKAEPHAVAADTAEILELGRRSRCRLLVIMHSSDRAEWQRELFEASPFRVAWLCASAAPPEVAGQVAAGFAAQAEAANRISVKLLGVRPGRLVVDDVPSEEEFSDRVQRARERFDEASLDSDALVVVPVASIASDDLVYAVGRKLLEHDFGSSVILVRESRAAVWGWITALRRWADSVTPPLTRSERVTLQEELESGSRPSWEFLGLISAASTLASFGLLQNSAAVIIGAMLIAPLMTPILGAGLAITMGNRPLFQSALAAIALGFAGAIGASGLFGLVVRLFETPDLSPQGATEMWARCNPSPLDFCVGLVGGMAAAYARTRSYLSSALAGAAIAAALVPPISTAGLQLVFGIWRPVPDGTPVWGPLLVVSINVLTIMVGSSFVLWMRGIRVHGGVRKQDRWAVRAVVVLIAGILLALAGIVGQ
jgi:uncharacterized hydrophobic protein (TIGR00271 family)